MAALPVWVDFLTDACEVQEAGFHFEEGGCHGMALALLEEMRRLDQDDWRIACSEDRGHFVVRQGEVALDHQGRLHPGAAARYTVVVEGSTAAEVARAAGLDSDSVEADLEWARRVIRSAKSLASEKYAMLGWPLRLASAGQIAKYIDGVSPSGVDQEFVEEYFRGTQACLMVVDLADIRVNAAGVDANRPVNGRDKAYRALPAETAPPLVVDERLCIEDGHHRRRAALARGDTAMLAYQAFDSERDLDLETESEEVSRPRQSPGL